MLSLEVVGRKPRLVTNQLANPNISVNSEAPKASLAESVGTLTRGNRMANVGEKNAAPPIPKVIATVAIKILIGNMNQ